MFNNLIGLTLKLVTPATGLLPENRMKLTMISYDRKGEKDAEKQAQ